MKKISLLALAAVAIFAQSCCTGSHVHSSSIMQTYTVEVLIGSTRSTPVIDTLSFESDQTPVLVSDYGVGHLIATNGRTQRIEAIGVNTFKILNQKTSK